jgi:Tfp pilus assembly protein PilP
MNVLTNTSRFDNVMTGLIRLFLVSLIILSPLRAMSAEEADAPADSTLSEGLQVIKDARENKLETPEERAGKSAGEEGPGAAPEPAEEAPDTTSPAQPGKVEPLATGEEKLPYDSTGMRDPFKPFIKLVDTPSSPSVVLRPPIQRYPLNQFRIVGIVWVGGKPQAMIVDPEANTYFLGVGDKIGSSDGEILEVRQNGILVQERTKMENVYGEVKIEVKQSVLAFQNDE